MRKPITTLLSGALLAVTLLAADSPAGPASAQAAGCKWQMPTRATIVQGNNHRVRLTYSPSDGYHKAKAYSRNELRTVSSEGAFTSFTPTAARSSRGCARTRSTSARRSSRSQRP